LNDAPSHFQKTTTLAALVNALHIKQFNKYYEELRRLATGDSSSREEGGTFRELSKHKPRILICAPSNAAVDNIILKIMEDGFIDGNGCRYNPVMCRLGSGQSAAVQVRSLFLGANSSLFLKLTLTLSDAIYYR